jgi:putative nucleotidyltransferase with HDIG domain
MTAKETEEKPRLFKEFIRWVITLDRQRGPDMADHQLRTAQLAVAIAEEMGLPKQQVDGIRVAALIHDLGKFSIPLNLLRKPAPLMAEEWETLYTHPLTGYNMLANLDFPWPVAKIVLQHHERLDGSGYPNGLAGEQILMEARILAVADVVEAMSYNRCYRAVTPGQAKALEKISQGRGVLFDPEVVDACLQVFSDLTSLPRRLPKWF